MATAITVRHLYAVLFILTNLVFSAKGILVSGALCVKGEKRVATIGNCTLGVNATYQESEFCPGTSEFLPCTNEIEERDKKHLLDFIERNQNNGIKTCLLLEASPYELRAVERLRKTTGTPADVLYGELLYALPRKFPKNIAHRNLTVVYADDRGTIFRNVSQIFLGLTNALKITIPSRDFPNNVLQTTDFFSSATWIEFKKIFSEEIPSHTPAQFLKEIDNTISMINIQKEKISNTAAQQKINELLKQAQEQQETARRFFDTYATGENKNSCTKALFACVEQNHSVLSLLEHAPWICQDHLASAGFIIHLLKALNSHDTCIVFASNNHIVSLNEFLELDDFAQVRTMRDSCDEEVYLDIVKTPKEIALPGKSVKNFFNALFAQCASCGKTETSKRERLKRCNRCSDTYYCSLECQKKDWPNHKKVCGKTAISTPEQSDAPELAAPVSSLVSRTTLIGAGIIGLATYYRMLYKSTAKTSLRYLAAAIPPALFLGQRLLKKYFVQEQPFPTLDPNNQIQIPPTPVNSTETQSVSFMDQVD